MLFFARQIVASGSPYSVIEIDDMWSEAYGDFLFNSTRFPSPKEMISELHNMGLLVTVWVTPFCDANAKAYAEGERLGYWVRERTVTGMRTARVM